MIRKVSLVALIFLCLTMQAHAETLIASSGLARVQLIELYSSESCSSCPPADQWISTLKDMSGLWKKFVPVVFHVDYWNHLGWKDGFSSDQMTKRQIALSQTWSEPAVYTPAVIVDGHEWKNWRSENQKLPEGKSRNIELSLFQEKDGLFRVRAVGLLAQKKYIVHFAKLGLDLKTDVKSGENSGQLLRHNFVVLDWGEKDVSRDHSEPSFQLKESNRKASKFAVVAWIEEVGSPVPLQSVGGYL